MLPGQDLLSRLPGKLSFNSKRFFIFFEVLSLARISITEATIYDCMTIPNLSVSFLHIPNYQHQQNC